MSAATVTALPSMEHTFTIEVIGSETKRVYQGTFSYKRPNLRAKCEIDKTEARLNGELESLDKDTKFLHEIFATLKHTLTDAPQWWKDADYGYDLFDLNVVLEIYKQTRNFETDWFEKVWGSEEKKEASKA